MFSILRFLRLLFLLFISPCYINSTIQAWKLLNEGRGVELIDPSIINNCLLSEALRWIHIALLCVQKSPANRPTISSIVLMLGSESVQLPKLLESPFAVGKLMNCDDSSSTTGSGAKYSMSDQSDLYPVSGV